MITFLARFSHIRGLGTFLLKFYQSTLSITVNYKNQSFWQIDKNNDQKDLFHNFIKLKKIVWGSFVEDLFFLSTRWIELETKSYRELTKYTLSVRRPP